MKIWKALGLAGLAGVAATGAIIARDQRKRSQLTPAEIRDRLQQRLVEVGHVSEGGSEGAGHGSGR
jgi:hypothetical protein